MSNVSLFQSREQREIDALKSEVKALTEEVHSLSESLTGLVAQMYYTMEVLGVGNPTEL